MLNVYEAQIKFQRYFPDAIHYQDLFYSNQYYDNDIGGFILHDYHRAQTYYLIHYTEIDKDWRSKTLYDKTMEGDAFFIPVRFVERAVMDDAILAFIVDSLPMFVLPSQIKKFYDGNNLAIDNGYGEIVVPVPLKMLSSTNLYRNI